MKSYRSGATGVEASGPYCAQCDAVMASQDASRWWCTEVCFQEWQTWRWRVSGPVHGAVAVEAKPR